MKTKVIHCRATEQEHKAISEAAKAEGLSITKFVMRAALDRVSTVLEAGE